MNKSRLFAGALVVCLSGCGGGAIPAKYTLPQPAVSTQVPVEDVRMSLAEVVLPGYARNSAISTLMADGTIVEDGSNRWAAAPAEAISQLLAQQIEQASGASVMLRPIPVAFRPNVRIKVTFDVFVRDTAGNALMQGQFSVDQAGEDFVLERFSIEQPAASRGYAQYMQATATGIEALASRIAARVVTE